jgi:hypothetical protein
VTRHDEDDDEEEAEDDVDEEEDEEADQDSDAGSGAKRVTANLRSARIKPPCIANGSTAMQMNETQSELNYNHT